MRSHVQTCVAFYGQAAHAVDWHDEIDAMVEALHRLPSEQAASFVLNDGSLQRVSQGE
jgi:hypothetical protein